MRCYNACVPNEQVQQAAQVKAGLGRRWVYLMPAVFVTYSLAYLDRANYGFGAAAHVIAQVILQQGREFHAFTRPGDLQAQEFARGLGAT